MNSQTRSKMSLILVLFAFILPVALAKLVLDNQWYETGVTNKGQLFPTPLSYQGMLQDNPQPGRWQLLYLLPSQCHQQCLDRLYILQQSHTALGKHRDRVTPLIMLTPHSDAAIAAELSLPQHQANQAMQIALAQGAIVIADPQGNLVMQYPQVTDHNAQLAQGKDLLADLRKMLKLSRIG
ncbi:hypothetical protein NFHSH190041_03220 [Shewanella sp. NFH-SH190041]|uniref:hypothetical protein n=1 Tax=Shewanella sp. NFH-SH190041 TaxID=2950245 RepID=UPI0021C39ED3|nr:hypothetical protein [Shewanella sp. NFH-SH190041]BDM62870.1 hypothetical protein NFHSH190041_03220 [Shewanella sp. NFH-SH190041]